MNDGPPALPGVAAIGVDADAPGSSRRPRRCPSTTSSRREHEADREHAARLGVDELLALGLGLGHRNSSIVQTSSRPGFPRSRATLVVVTARSRAQPRRGAGPAPGPALGWRLATPVAFVLTGALFVASAHNSEGTDLRPGPLHRPRLPGQHREPAGRPTSSARSRRSQDEVDRLAAGVREPGRAAAAARGRRARGPRPASPRCTGPGITVTLSDAPARGHQLLDRSRSSG